MEQSFNNKVVAITGGTDGIGKALVQAMLAKGATVATCARNQDKLYQLQTQNAGAPLLTVVADVSKENDCRHFIESTLHAFGKIDILINNAGISMRALFADAEIDVIRKLMDVNFYGALCCTKYALDSIIKQKGVIVGVSSIAGYRGLPGRTGYSASKFALQGWLESLRTEMLDKEVNVMWVCPGFTTSNIRQAALNEKAEAHGETSMDEEKMMSAATCADHIVKAIEERKRTLILTFNGIRTVWLNKLFPKLTDKLVHRFFFKKGKLIQ